MITRKNHQKHENDTKDKWEQVHVRLTTTATLGTQQYNDNDKNQETWKHINRQYPFWKQGGE